MSGWWWLAVVTLVVVSVSEPQTNQLQKGCSQFNASDVVPADFFRELNACFADLRDQLSDRSNNKRFATTGNLVYAMAQCRNYLSKADCVSCFDAAVSVTGDCSISNGARVIFDGCFLRFETHKFYDQTTLPGNTGICSNQTARKQHVFNASAQKLLNELVVATPRIKGFYAAAKRGGSGGGTIYGVAQCAETVSQSGCQDCLETAYKNIQGCLPKFADGRGVDAGCFLRYSDTPFFADNQTTDITPFLGGGIESVRSSPRSSENKKAIFGAVGGGVGTILVLEAIFLLYLQSKKPKASRIGNILLATQLRGSENYRYKDLKAATKDFREGTLKNGDVVAVKKLATISNRANADFETEVRLISNVHHPNLIRLLGYSGNGEVMLLVYEYMPNTSLDRYIYGVKRGMLNWKQRVDIIFGTTRGLAYLHEVSIIHRDIKSSNILLDDKFLPKIADFGLARLIPENQSHLTTKFAGTLGYTAPEYAIHGHLSEKVDIYSFGIVVLEIISGRRSGDIQDELVTEYLLEHAWKLYENEKHLEVVDNSLDPNEYKVEEMKRMLEIALVCTQSPANLRPTMSELVVMLSSIDGSIIHIPENRPTIIADFDKRVLAVAGSSTPTNATISFSRFSGR